MRRALSSAQQPGAVGGAGLAVPDSLQIRGTRTAPSLGAAEEALQQFHVYRFVGDVRRKFLNIYLYITFGFVSPPWCPIWCTFLPIPRGDVLEPSYLFSLIFRFVIFLNCFRY